MFAAVARCDCLTLFCPTPSIDFSCLKYSSDAFTVIILNKSQDDLVATEAAKIYSIYLLTFTVRVVLYIM